MAAKNSVQAIPLTNIASSTFTGSYQAINPNGLPNACFLIRLNSTSSTSVTVSFDGVNDHEFLLNGAFVNLDFQNNAQPNNFAASLKAGTVIWVKGSAGTGNIYLSGYYQPTQ